MKVLLTGASGFLGSHVLHALRQHGVPVWTLGRSCPPGQAATAHVQHDLLAGGDLAGSLRRIAPSHLLHLAWVTDHASYRTSPCNADWAQATLRLAEAFCDAGGRHLVVGGSCAEYDWSHGWCHEGVTPLVPATPYGAAKDATRRRLQVLCAGRGLRLAWARIFFPFGTGQSPQWLIPSLVSALQGTRAPFTVQALQQRDFVSAPDVAGALWTLLQAPADGCFNISSARPVAVGELVRTLAHLLDADPQPLLALACTQLQAPALVAGDNTRLRTLGWSGPGDLVDALARLLVTPADAANAAQCGLDPDGS